MATIEDFKKLELRIGKIKTAERIPNSEKLVKLSVSFGALGERQIIAGIALTFPDLALLIGRLCVFAYNIEPRMLMGYESQGMLLATGEVSTLSLLSVDQTVPEGSIVR